MSGFARRLWFGPAVPPIPSEGTQSALPAAASQARHSPPTQHGHTALVGGLRDSGSVGAAWVFAANSPAPTLLWRNATTGQDAAWTMSGVTRVGTTFLDPVPDPTWTIVGSGDFNGDGYADVVWRNNTSGQNAVWTMAGLRRTATVFLDPVPDPAWTIGGVGDFNSDGSPDLVWRNTSTGQNAVWLMTGLARTATVFLETVSDVSWTIGAVGIVGGYQSGIAWRNTVTGQNAFWRMSGTTRTATVFLDPVGDLNWSIVGTLDENGSRGLVWRSTVTGRSVSEWSVSQSMTNSSPSISGNWSGVRNSVAESSRHRCSCASMRGISAIASAFPAAAAWRVSAAVGNGVMRSLVPHCGQVTSSRSRCCSMPLLGGPTHPH